MAAYLIFEILGGGFIKIDSFQRQFGEEIRHSQACKVFDSQLLRWNISIGCP